MVVVKWRNKICLDLKTTMTLWEGFLLNHKRVDFKLIMKQYWLLSVENDEAIVRNGCEEKDLKIWKKQIFISWLNVFFFFLFLLDEFLMNPALLFIVERRRMVVVQSRMAVENFWWDWWLGMVDGNGRHQTRMVGWRLVGTDENGRLN